MVHEPLKKPQALPQVPGYKIEGILGRGATGIVYRARQLSVDRVIALKVLHTELVGQTAAARRMQREARTTARLAHPNIISAIDMGEIDGRWWYAMELVDGQTLQERIAERTLGEREALRMFIPLIEALQHAFERGVVHRDIKPANILIERGGRALLVDLGLAVAEDDPLLTKGGGTLGTPAYISPEQARDPAGADVQSDLWSLGATLYHAVCGRPPFAGDSVAEILSNVLYAPIPDPAEFAPALSSGFVLVLRKCLTRERKARYATPAELLADLERLRERRAPNVRRSTLEPLARGPHARRRTWLGAGALALALVAVGGYFVSTHKNDDGAHAPPNTGDPLERLAAAVEGPALGLSSALEEAERMRGTELEPHTRDRLGALASRLEKRLDDELALFEQDTEKQIGGRLAARDFSGAESLAGRSLRSSLALRIGPRGLPVDKNRDFDHWLEKQSDRVRDARADAEQAFTVELDRHVSESLLPRVDLLERDGDFRAARELLTKPPAELLLAAHIDTHGLAPRTLERGQSALRARLDLRREALDAEWKRIDLELESWIVARRADLERKAQAQDVSDPAAELDRQWAAELARRGLTLERLPLGLLHLADEAHAHEHALLEQVEGRLADEISRKSFEELETQTAELWRARLYEEIAQRFDARPVENWRPALRPRVELVRRQTQMLEGLLRRAAAGLRVQNGQHVELRVGTILLPGKLDAGGDPLASGFRLLLDNGQARALALHSIPGSSPAPALLAAEALEQLAGIVPDTADPKLQLLRALLRLRDASPDAAAGAEAARAILDAGPLPSDDPLVPELARAVQRERERTRAGATPAEPRNEAQDRLRTLRGMVLRKADPESARVLARELLQKYADQWSLDEQIELRKIRDESAGSARTSLDELLRVLGPNEITGLPQNRVKLRYDFRSVRAGAFDPGSWGPDGAGWAALHAARSDADFLESKAPTLALGEAFALGSEVLDLRLTFESKNAPQNLLLISVAGFHVALAPLPLSEGVGVRVLADTQDAAQLVKRVHGGEVQKDKLLAGWKPGSSFEVHLVLKRARGQVQVEIDKKPIPPFELIVPRDDPAAAALVVRSWEGVRLTAVTIEATPRKP